MTAKAAGVWGISGVEVGRGICGGVKEVVEEDWEEVQDDKEEVLERLEWGENCRDSEER